MRAGPAAHVSVSWGVRGAQQLTRQPPGAAGELGLGVCAGERASPPSPPQEVATYPAGRTGVVVVSFLLHFGFSIAQLMLLKEFLMCLLLKVSVLHAGFFHGNVSPASGLMFYCIFPIKIFDQVPWAFLMVVL